MTQRNEAEKITVGTMQDYAQSRLDVAGENLFDARLLLNQGRYKAANNRSYYAIFHAINTILAIDGKSFKSHKEAISSFNYNYIRTGIFPKEYGRKIARAQEKRHSSDYDYAFSPSPEETVAQVEFAEKFVSAIKEFCSGKLNTSIWGGRNG